MRQGLFCLFPMVAQFKVIFMKKFYMLHRLKISCVFDRLTELKACWYFNILPLLQSPAFACQPDLLVNFSPASLTSQP